MDPRIPEDAQINPLWVRRCRLLLLGSWLACLITTLLVPCTNSEVTPFAGPVIFLLGLATIAYGMVARARQVAWLGLAHCLICGLFVGLVNAFGWGPKQAMLPFFLLGLAWTVAAGIYAHELRRRLPLYQPWQCQRCGYPLFGLSRARCPECGEPFTPAQLADPRLARAPEPPDPRP